MKLRILHKGLLFLILPLCLQIACFAQLYLLIAHAQQLNKQMAKVAESADLCNEIFAEYGNTWADCLTLRIEHSVNPDDYLAHMRGLFDALEKAVPKESRRFVESGRKTTTEQYQLLKRLAALNSDSSVFTRIQVMLELRPEMVKTAQMAKEMQIELQRQRISLDAWHNRQSKAMDDILRQVLMVIVAEILLTVFSIVLFLRNITKRLNMLMDNANCIPANAELTHRVGGRDELAYLDHVLHKASQDLKSAAEYRSSLMQMVAHDLRSPLGSAQLAVQTLAQTEGMTDQQRSSRARAVTSTLDQLMRFVEDLLSVDKLEAGKLELQIDAVELKSLVESAVQSAIPVAEQKSVIVKNEVGDIAVAGDRDRLMQVLGNLITNAVKFSPKGEAVRVTSQEEPGAVRISIIDKGPGIPAAQQERLFQKFYQGGAGKSAGGFGLGLAIAKMIVECHGGQIGVVSESGQGTTMWFTLPVTDED